MNEQHGKSKWGNNIPENPACRGGWGKHSETEEQITEKESVSLYRELMCTLGKVKVCRYTRREPVPVQTPTLVLYALADRERLTDLQPSNTFVRALLQQGLEVYTLEWGQAARSARFFTLHDYVNEYLDEAVDHLLEKAGTDKVNLLGVGQGGTIGAIYAAIHPQKVRNLITVLAPIAFPTTDGALFGWARQGEAAEKGSHIPRRPHFHGPAEAPAAAMGVPAHTQEDKCNALLQLIEEKQKLLSYLRMGSWFYGHLKQSGECFRQLVEDLYRHNKLVKGALQVGPYKVNLRYITMPVLNVCVERDLLVPIDASLPFNTFVGAKDKACLRLKAEEGGKATLCREIGAAVGAWLKKRDRA